MVNSWLWTTSIACRRKSWMNRPTHAGSIGRASQNVSGEKPDLRNMSPIQPVPFRGPTGTTVWPRRRSSSERRKTIISAPPGPSDSIIIAMRRPCSDLVAPAASSNIGFVKGFRRGQLVFVGSHRPLPLALPEEDGPFAARDQRRKWALRARP